MNRQHRADRLAHETARAAAAATVREAIQQAAVVAFGATVREEPIDGLEVAVGGRVGVLDDPLAGVAAARLALGVAETQMQRYALTARAAGRSWDDVAAALDLPEHTTAAGEDPMGAPREQTAFEWLIDEQRPRPDQDWWQRPPASWRCSQCQARVVDQGPFESHPDDREPGHTADCPRRAAALERWASDQDQQDQQDQHDQHHDDSEHDEHEHGAEDGGGDGGGGRR